MKAIFLSALLLISIGLYLHNSNALQLGGRAAGGGLAPGTLNVVASITPTSGTYVPGLSTTFMTVTANMSSGTFSGGIWTVSARGTDNSGATCTDYGSDLTININTGAIINSTGASGAYPSFCVAATPSGGTAFIQVINVHT